MPSSAGGSVVDSRNELTVRVSRAIVSRAWRVGGGGGEVEERLVISSAARINKLSPKPLHQSITP
jgi:hypothetical protein